MASKRLTARQKTAHSTTNRRTGRPAKGLADLRARLLDAALVAFSHLGASATQSRDVAKIAGVAPALVNYYFENREGLIRAVADERLDPLLDRIWAPVKDESIPDDRMLLRYTHESIMVAREYHWFAPLWIREFMTEGGALHEHNEKVRNEVGRLQARIRRGQQKGLIPTEYSPELLMWSIIGLTLFPFAAEPAIKIRRNNDAALLDKCKNHSEEMMRRALAIEGTARTRSASR